MWSNENSAVRAEENWWGSAPPAADAFIATNNSTLDYTPWLTSDPNRRYLAGSDGGSEYTQGRSTNPFDHTTLSGLNLARYLHSQGDNNAAFAQYQTVILNDPNSAQSQYALRRIVECFPGSSPNALVNYLNQIAASHFQEALGKLAGHLTVEVLADNGQYPQAITRGEDLLNDYPDDLDMQRNILYTMGTIYANDMNDATGAAQAYSELLALPTLCTEDGMIENINLFFTNNGMTPRIAGESPEDREPWLPDKFALEQNVPNPFNPKTVIAYHLPEASQVILKVYDLTGREVETMVDRQEQAGFKQVTWNGMDNHGKPVASGLYIYTLSATSTESKQTFHQSRKLVLLR